MQSLMVEHTKIVLFYIAIYFHVCSLFQYLYYIPYCYFLYTSALFRYNVLLIYYYIVLLLLYIFYYLHMWVFSYHSGPSISLYVFSLSMRFVTVFPTFMTIYIIHCINSCMSYIHRPYTLNHSDKPTKHFRHSSINSSITTITHI